MKKENHLIREDKTLSIVIPSFWHLGPETMSAVGSCIYNRPYVVQHYIFSWIINFYARFFFVSFAKVWCLSSCVLLQDNLEIRTAGYRSLHMHNLTELVQGTLASHVMSN